MQVSFMGLSSFWELHEWRKGIVDGCRLKPSALRLSSTSEKERGVSKFRFPLLGLAAALAYYCHWQKGEGLDPQPEERVRQGVGLGSVLRPGLRCGCFSAQPWLSWLSWSWNGVEIRIVLRGRVWCEREGEEACPVNRVNRAWVVANLPLLLFGFELGQRREVGISASAWFGLNPKGKRRRVMSKRELKRVVSVCILCFGAEISILLLFSFL